MVVLDFLGEITFAILIIFGFIIFCLKGYVDYNNRVDEVNARYSRKPTSRQVNTAGILEELKENYRQG